MSNLMVEPNGISERYVRVSEGKMPRTLIDFYCADKGLAQTPENRGLDEPNLSPPPDPTDRMDEEPIRATIIEDAGGVGLGVVYEASNGTKHARQIGPQDWPLIDRLHYGGRLVFARADLRNRYLEAACQAGEK